MVLQCSHKHLLWVHIPIVPFYLTICDGESVCPDADYIDDTASKVIWCVVNIISSIICEWYHVHNTSYYFITIVISTRTCTFPKMQRHSWFDSFNSILSMSQRLLHQFRRRLTLELILKSLMIWQIYTIGDITMDVVERKLLTCLLYTSPSPRD